MEKPKKLKRAVIKEELVAVSGNYIDAIILQQFLYWTDRVSDFDDFQDEEREIARKSGVEYEPHYSFGWIYKSAKELSEETMLGLSDSSVRSHVQNLINKGFLLERNNPNYKWDRKKQYRINLTHLQQELFAIGYALEGYKIDISEFAAGFSETENAFSETENGTSKNRRAIPETTTETTTDITTKEKENIKENFSPAGAVIEFPLKDGTTYVVTEQMITEWKTTYPMLNVRQLVKEMRLWLLSNPTKGKTQKGIPRFVTSWLGREKDKLNLKGVSTDGHSVSKGNSGEDGYYDRFGEVGVCL